jgi:hypothetical protein
MVRNRGPCLVPWSLIVQVRVLTKKPLRYSFGFGPDEALHIN